MERLSVAPIRHRRLPRALVRGISGSQPFDCLRHISASRRRFALLAQFGSSGPLGDVDRPGDVAGVWHRPASSDCRHCSRSLHYHGPGRSDEPADYRRLRRPVRADAFSSCRSRRPVFKAGKFVSLLLYFIRSIDPQRDIGSAFWHLRAQVGSYFPPYLCSLPQEGSSAAAWRSCWGQRCCLPPTSRCRMSHAPTLPSAPPSPNSTARRFRPA